MSPIKFREQAIRDVVLQEAEGDRPRRIRAIGAVADIINRNNRLYPADVLREAVIVAQADLVRSLSQGRYGLLGEADHPAWYPRLLDTVVKWESIRFNESSREVELDGRLLETAAGQDVIAMMEAGVLPGVSLRGRGNSEVVVVDGDVEVERVTSIKFTGFDLVFEQSFEDARVTHFEHTEAGRDAGDREPKMSKTTETVETTEAAVHPDAELAKKLADQLEANKTAAKELEEARKQAAEAEARAQELGAAKAELERIQREAARDKAIAEATSNLPYGEAVNAQFVEAVKSAALEAPEQVAQFVEARRKEYDAILAAAKIKAQGHDVTVLGPTYERQTGNPEYSHFAVELREHMQRHTVAGAQSADAKAGKLAKRYLEAFDKAYRPYLVDEGRKWQQFQEVELTTDLSLPYLVTRAVVEEAVPLLVAANVFDMDLVDGNPARVWFESYSHYSNTVLTTITDETATANDDVWQNLAHRSIVPGTVIVEAGGTSNAFAEKADYLIDYEGGRIKTLGAGAISDGADLDVSYQYEKIREGENQPIQRGKATLTAKDITLVADRLAAFVTDEALTFSASNLNWDAAARTAMMIVRELNERIDQRIFYAARTAALESGNSGGSWTASGADYDDLVAKIGVAKAAVLNDHYRPQAIVASVTNAERLRNWDGFSRNGMADASLGAGGTEMVVKGLPVFESTQMADDVILVVHPELVMHRVYSGAPMMLKGPFEVRNGDGLLVAGQEWYAQEYNQSFTPIAQKGGYVIVA